MSTAGANPSSSEFSRRRAPHWWECALLVFFAVVVVKNGIIPGWKVLQTDFPNYYLAARLHAEGLPSDREYEWTWFQRQKNLREIDQRVVAYAHPPLCALPFLPLAHLQPLAAKHAWIIINLAFLVVIVWLLSKIARLTAFRTVLVVLACTLPLYVCLLLGQYYILILLLLCLAFFLYKRERPSACGAVLGLAAALKIFPGLLVLVFLKQRNWRALAATFMATITWTALAIWIFEWEVHRVFFVEILPRSLSGDVIDPYNPGWSSWSALWHRWFLFEPGLNPHPLLNSTILYAITKAMVPVLGLFAFWWSTKNWTQEERDWQWALALTLSLFLSSVPSSYHYILLALPMCIAVSQMDTAASRRLLLLTMVGYLVLSVNMPHLSRGIPRLVGTTLMFAAMVAFGRPLTGSVRGAIVAVSMLAAFIGLSLWSLRGRSDALSEVVPVNITAISISSPAVSANGLAFSMLGSTNYELGLVLASGTHSIHPPGDVLSVSATPRSADIYFEVSAATSSIQMLNAKGLTDITQGESPVISPNANVLAFIRETKGRGALWVRNLHSQSERLLTSNEYDVLEATFASEEELVMAARIRNSPPQAFAIDGQGNITVLPMAGRVRYPSISSDHRLLAFSRLEGSSWHLFSRSLSSGQETRLTEGNCNTISPTWRDSHTIIFVSDCARGLGLPALASITVR
jgi:hypothetical protein